MAGRRKKASGLSRRSCSSTPQASSTLQATGTPPSQSSNHLPMLPEAPPKNPDTPTTPVTTPETASKQSPPISFDKFASSEIFTIRAGAELQAFHVHKDLLAGLSDEMRNHVYNDMKEGQANRMDLKHISPETMHRFMEFCYSGDYLFPPGAEKKDPLKDKEATEALPILLTHARLYVFAEMFNIVSLKKLSADKIIAIAPLFGGLEERAHGLAMISLMEFVLDNIPATTETTDRLVKFLARYSGYLVNKIGDYPEFHAVLSSSAREDFFRVFCKWVKPGGDMAPWTDLE